MKSDIWGEISEWLASLRWDIMGVTLALSLLFLLLVGVIFVSLYWLFHMKVLEALLVVAIIVAVVTAAYNIAKKVE